MRARAPGPARAPRAPRAAWAPWAGWATAVVAASAVLACAPATDARGPDLEIGVSPTPPTVGPARILVRVTDPVAMEEPSVVLTPIDPAGRRRPPVPAQPSGTGWVVPALSFDLPGRWAIEVLIRSDAGDTLTLRTRAVTVVGPP